MTSYTNGAQKSGVFRWFASRKNQESTVIRIRGIGWFSLLKLLLIGYAGGSLPFIALLNYAIISAPNALSDEVKKAISLPAVLWIWPVGVCLAAWLTNFFVGFGLRIFGSFWPLEIRVFLDAKKTSEPPAPGGSGS